MKDNVKVVRGKGGACFVCDAELPVMDPVISVSFEIPALVTTINVKRDMHLDCALDLRNLLDLRIRQAQAGHRDS